MNVEESYQQLKQVRLTTSHTHFSKLFLGKSDRYLDYLICSGAKPSTNALTTLYFRMKHLAQRLTETGSQTPVTIVLEEVADDVWGELEQRGLSENWRARKSPVKSARAIDQTDRQMASI